MTLATMTAAMKASRSCGPTAPAVQASAMATTDSFETDPAKPDQWIWLSGDSLCSPNGMCFDSSANEHNDVSEVHGVQGTDQANTSELLPEAALQPYPDNGYATPAETPDRSAMIDADVNVDETGNAIEEELFRNDATRVGDIEVFQVAGPAGVETAEGRSASLACSANRF